MDDYGFSCDCDRCKVEAHWSDNEEQEEEEEELMDEDDVGAEAEAEAQQDDSAAECDFPHAYFFVRYMCNRNNCWGTLAPLPDTPNLLECNVCANLTHDHHA